MDPKEILKFCLERGILLDKEVLNLITEASDLDAARLMIEKVQENTHQKVITKKIFAESISHLKVPGISEDKQKNIEKLKIRLGLELEISKEVISSDNSKELLEQRELGVDVFSFNTTYNKKIEVDNFTNYFRSRLLKLKGILQSHQNLKNLVSINKISNDRQNFSVIGIVSDKRTTKNGNILLSLEDFTGNIRVLINQNKPDLYKKGEEITLDSVIGVSGSGNKEIIFANDFLFPDSTLSERKKAPFEEYALFIGDIHFGSKLFLRDGFLKFINYLNGNVPNTPEVSKIKYLFIMGDLVAGVGVYPEQERDLIINNLEEQYKGFAELLKMIRKDITIIITPGNHDGVRLMEPQPTFDKKYAFPLYDLDNVILATNPARVTIAQKNGFSGIDVLVYHGFSYPYYADSIPFLIQANAINSPDKIMAYLLKNRHLAPTHSSTQYFPFDEDPLVIEKVPDIFVSGHTHKCAISFYNNTLIISGAAWEAKTDFQEKMGNEPDFCKVPIVNLKTGGVKILDFE